MLSPRAQYWHLSALNAFIFGAVGVTLPFWPVWLESRVADPGLIGMLLGVMMLTRIIVDPFFAQAMDRRGERKRPLMAAFVLCAGAYGLFLAHDHVIWLLVLSVITGAAFAPIVPLSNMFTLRGCTSHGLEYGRIRLWGSIAFILVSMGSGYLIERAGIDMVIYLVIGLMGLGLLTLLRLPDIRPERPAPPRPALRQLLSDRKFLVFLSAMALIQSSHGFYYGFGTLYWRELGYTDVMVGVFWSVGVLAEIVLFFVAKRYRLMDRPIMLMIIAALGALIRWVCLAFTEAGWAIIALQTLHACSFGCAHLGAMSYITKAVPEEVAVTAQSLNAAMVMGGGLGLTTWLSGPLFAAFGGTGFAVMGAIALTGLGCVLWLDRLWERPDTGRSHS